LPPLIRRALDSFLQQSDTILAINHIATDENMRALKFLLLVGIFGAGAAVASPDNPVPGREFVELKDPQPVTAAAPGKIEVIEFFMYHCPACNALEPTLKSWVPTREGAVSFRRVHIPHAEKNDPEAHLFLALDAMQLEGALHDKVMHTWHVERRRLLSDADNAQWAAANGIDQQKFHAFYDSFSVTAKLRNLTRYVNGYGVDSTPTLVIDGRYLTTPAMIGEANPELTGQTIGPATMKVVDALIERARKQKH
jgi:thiol:disulfide interchange protein DsbA